MPPRVAKTIPTQDLRLTPLTTASAVAFQITTPMGQLAPRFASAADAFVYTLLAQKAARAEVGAWGLVESAPDSTRVVAPVGSLLVAARSWLGRASAPAQPEKGT